MKLSNNGPFPRAYRRGIVHRLRNPVRRGNPTTSAVVRRKTVAKKGLLDADKKDIGGWIEGYDATFDAGSDARGHCAPNVRTQSVKVSTPEGVVLEVDFSSMQRDGVLRNAHVFMHVLDAEYKETRVRIPNPSRHVLLALQRRLITNRAITL